MTEVQSPKLEVKKKASEVFSFLSDFNNYKVLMPDQVEHWLSTAEDCSFTIKNMAKLSMKFLAKTPDSKIEIIPSGKAPFDFKLFAFIEGAGETSTVQFAFHADLNPFIKMVAEKPLANFVSIMADRFKKHMNGETGA